MFTRLTTSLLASPKRLVIATVLGTLLGLGVLHDVLMLHQDHARLNAVVGFLTAQIEQAKRAGK